MSLPPALLSRLAKRGVIKVPDSAAPNPAEPTPEALPPQEEEVIAEDYDDIQKTSAQQDAAEPEHLYYELEHKPPTLKKPGTFWIDRIKKRMEFASSYAGFKYCPNKSNVWHVCSLYCVNKYSGVEYKDPPSEGYMRRLKRLVRKYPLPSGWKKIYDPGCKCYYFANADKLLVSWLPPSHPKAQVSKSAAIQRRQMQNVHDYDSSGEADNEDIDGEPTSTAVVNHNPAKKQKSRDLERTISKQRGRQWQQ